MSKITLEFNIPEEQEEADITLSASKMHSVIWDTLQDIRSQIKYREDNKEWDVGAEWVRNLIVNKLEEENITNLF